ncbi:MAG: hypothetical protein AAF986_09020 [Pseudomonadota bacterium]
MAPLLMGTIVALWTMGISKASADTAVFDTDEAAKCAASFAYTLDAMQAAPSIPQEIRRRMRDGLAIWEYELSASAPNATPAMLQAAANRAVAVVRAGMPDGAGPDIAAQRGDYLTMLTTKCAAKITAAYGDDEHPVIPFLRQADADALVPPPARETASNEGDEARERGLR